MQPLHTPEDRERLAAQSEERRKNFEELWEKDRARLAEGFEERKRRYIEQERKDLEDLKKMMNHQKSEPEPIKIFSAHDATFIAAFMFFLGWMGGAMVGYWWWR